MHGSDFETWYMCDNSFLFSLLTLATVDYVRRFGYYIQYLVVLSNGSTTKSPQLPAVSWFYADG